MLFRQKGKVPDIGKDNFQEFMRNEKDSVALTNNSLSKPNTLHYQQGLVENRSIKQNGLQRSTMKTQTNLFQNPQNEEVSTFNPAQLLLDGSCKASGSTWDALHLDAFLKTSKFAQTGENVFRTMVLKQNESYAPNSSIKESYFLRNKQPRLAPEKSAAHYFYQSPINHLVTRPEDIGQDTQLDENKRNFINKQILTVPDKNFDAKKIYYTPNPDAQSDDQATKLSLPSEKIRELQEAKKNIQEYQDWRKEFFQRNKSYRVAKNAFKSGIVNLDNPEIEGTLLYKQENDNIKRQQLRSLEGKKFRQQQIDKFNNANPTIEFDNYGHVAKDIQDNRNDDLLKKNTQFPIQNHEFHRDWIKKKSVNEFYVLDKQNTNDRLFGNNLNEIKAHTITQRALYLRSQELRGRDYDMISMTKNELPILN